MEFTSENIEKLIYELYYNQNVSIQSEANQYLTLAQLSPHAWQLGWGFLDKNKPIEVQYFGASTLYLKVAKCWGEIQEDSERQLVFKNQLIQTIINYMSLEGCRIIETRLLLTLSSFVIHSITTWENGVEDLISTFQPTNFSHVPGDRVLTLLIELLSIIPEEFQTNHFNLYQKTIIRSHLLKSIGPVFSLIYAVMSEHNISVDLRLSTIKCFANWSEKTGPLIFSDNHSEILLMILQSMCTRDLCQTAVDAVTNIYTHPEIHKFPNSILQLVDSMVCLESHLNKAIQESDDQVCTNIYTLFIQIAETHSRLLLDSIIDKPQHKDSIFKLISIILQCSSTPGHYPVDETFSEQAFNFWYTLQDDIIASDEPRMSQYIALFFPLFQSLIDAFLIKVQYPPDELYDQWDDDEKESFRCYRQDIGDSFMYCYNILRVSMLSNLLAHYTIAGNNLTTNINTTNDLCWQYLESVIYAVGSIAENVDIQEEAYLPQIFNSLTSIPYLDIKSPRLLGTTMDTIGAYSEWISNHSDYLPNVISLIVLGLKSHQFVTISATMALKDMISECQMMIQPYAQQILAVSQELLSLERLKSKEKARLMCTVGLVLSVMPIEFIMDNINPFVTPIFLQLQHLVQLSDTHPSKNSPLRDQVSTHLNMLAMLFSTLDTNLKRVELYDGEDINIKKLAESTQSVNDQKPQPIFIILQQVLPLLANIAYKWSSDETITESLCECIKKSVITLLNEVKPFVNDILQLLMHLYSTAPQSSILDISKQLIILFGKDPNLETPLKNYYVQVCNHTLTLCQHNLRQETCLVEMFYSVSVTIIKKMINFFHYNLLDVASLFRCAMSALTLPEKPTVRATSGFITEFINNARDIESMNRVINQDIDTLLAQVLIVIGGTSDSPRTVVEHMSDILMSLNQKYFDNLSRSINVYITKELFPTARATRELKQHYVRLILKERKNKRKLKEIINEFSLTCRGLIGTEYGNQVIKLPF